MKDASESFCFAAMRSVSRNVGEEIQWVAQEQFLPHVDCLASKCHLSEFRPKKPTKLIMNGYYHIDLGRELVPGDKVDPLLISMHIYHGQYKALKNSRRAREFLLRHSPVGCRDMVTLEFFKSIDIPAYFSGCLTLTLQRNEQIPKNDYIVCVGLSDDEIKVVKERTSHRVITSDRLMPLLFGQETRMDVARAFLALYQGAHCVVTKMLHVSLPCLALGTPVLLIEHNSGDKDHRLDRYAGFLDTLHHVTHDKFVAGKYDFDFDAPPPNPTGYLAVRDGLIETCKRFTGIEALVPQLTVTDPLGYFVKILSTWRYYGCERWHATYAIEKSEMLKALWYRCFCGRVAGDLYF